MRRWNWHWIAWGTGLLMMTLALFYCGLSVAGAMEDMGKFDGLGFSNSFAYYLKKNDFGAALWPLLCVTAEFVLYVTQRKRWLLAVLFGLHMAMWIHAVILSVPAGIGYNPAGYYLRFAWMTLLPAAVYFVSSFLCAKEPQRKSTYK